MDRQRIRMARLIRVENMDRSFDLEFWSRMGSEERFNAAWQMVLEVNAIKGKDIHEPRLQRSVQHIERISR
jgi:hypothetical protein